MHIPPLPPMRLLNWRRVFIAFAALSSLAGCANGDFQEVRPSLVRDDIHDWVGSAAIAGIKTSPSKLPLTDDERSLRDLAYPLIQPPYDRQQWYAVFGEYGLIKSDHQKTFDRAAYANHLLATRDRSPSARYSRLIDDIHNDTERLPQFFETATRVLDMDRKRRESMAYVSALSKHERNEALRRNYVNASIVLLVRTKLNQRVAGYRFALERLVIMTPSQQAVEAEQALNRLQAQIAYYSNHTAPTWQQEPSLVSSD
jgi:hypothetical protein